MDKNFAKCVIFLLCVALVSSTDSVTDTSKELGKEDVFPREATTRTPVITVQEETASVTCPEISRICYKETLNNNNMEALKCYLEAAKESFQKAEAIFLTVGVYNSTSEQQGTQHQNQNCPVCNCPSLSDQDYRDLLLINQTTSVGSCSNTSEQQGTQKQNQNCPVCNCPACNCPQQSAQNCSHLLQQRTLQQSRQCPVCISVPQTARDCTDLLLMGNRHSGVYTIQAQLNSTVKSMRVYCDMETDGGGWTVIQRRGPFQNGFPYFIKPWKDYKGGFGDLSKEFWLGNDNIFLLTNAKECMVRFDLVGYDKIPSYAAYKTFRIRDETQKYKLHITDYLAGTLVDAMKSNHNGMFSTIDQDNDLVPHFDCVVKFKAAWWYNQCEIGSINGYNHHYYDQGMNWGQYSPSYKRSEIKIRQRSFKS